MARLISKSKEKFGITVELKISENHSLSKKSRRTFEMKMKYMKTHLPPLLGPQALNIQHHN